MDLMELGLAERALLSAIRRYALGCIERRQISALFRYVCVETDAEMAALSVQSLLAVIALFGRRRLGLHPPGCPAVSVDEQALLAAYAAAGRGAHAELKARLAWLLRSACCIDAGKILLAGARALDLASGTRLGDGLPRVVRPQQRCFSPSTAAPLRQATGPGRHSASWPPSRSSR